MLNQIRNKLITSRNARQAAICFIFFIARFFKFDLMIEIYKKRGILNYETAEISGEEFIIHTWLRKWLVQNGIENPVIMDVGANVGNYSKEIAQEFQNASIHAFEPHPITCEKLRSQLGGYPNVTINQVAVGAEAGKITLHGTPDNRESEHYSVYKNVLSDQHTYVELCELVVPVITLDSYCKEQEISKVHFLKIDTEGHEFDGLMGAKSLIDQGSISVIQFEFNEMNIISRRFLKDFKDLLKEYDLFRIHSKTLVPLDYSSKEEIFLFQNFLAVARPLQHQPNLKSASLE
jgi:FkbM family methyltransferase